MKNTILLVDDNEDMRQLFIELFNDSDIHVVCFASVAEAKIYLKNPISLSKVKAIISDLMMGPTDGLEFLTYAKEKAELQHIDFYLLTGSATPALEPLLKSSVLTGIIEKPFDVKSMVALLTNSSSYCFQKTI